MARRTAKAILRDPSRILDKLREVPISRRSLNWECISKPLKEDPNDLANIHDPTLEEYKMKYRLGKKAKTVYDWWYSAILKDQAGEIHFLILAFHPKWSFYRVIHAYTSGHEENLWAAPKSVEASQNFLEKVGYSERDDTIDLWIKKAEESDSQKHSLARCTVRPRASRLTIRTDEISVNLAFKSLGLPFWVNKGREATTSPRGDTMSGFYDVCQVDGSFFHGQQKTEVSGVGVNEHLMSFTPPDRFWSRVDGIFFCTDQIYCALIYLEKKIPPRTYDYKDGAVFIRETKEYLIPTEFRIEYLKSDNSRKVPTKTQISVTTEKGEICLTTQALAETEKQIAFSVVEGQFSFNDGRKLKLTNGYGQHALH